MRRKRYLGAYTKGHGKNRKVIPITHSSRHHKQSNMTVASKIAVKEKSVERAMVKDERTGETEYLKMAAEAEKEGRHQDAKIFREHAHDEAQHGKEDAKILKDSQRKPQWEWEHDGYHVVSAEEAKKHPELYG